MIKHILKTHPAFNNINNGFVTYFKPTYYSNGLFKEKDDVLTVSAAQLHTRR